MSRKGYVNPEKEKFWRAVFREFQKSGLPFREFCEKEGHSPNSFQGWRRKLRLKDEAKGIVSKISKGENRPDKTKENCAFWLRVIEEIEDYPGSINQYLKEHRLTSGSLWHWERRLVKEGLTSGISTNRRNVLVPVEIIDTEKGTENRKSGSRATSETWKIEVRGNDGISTFFPSDTPIELLIKFVNGLEDDHC